MRDDARNVNRRTVLRDVGGLAALGTALLAGCVSAPSAEATPSPTEASNSEPTTPTDADTEGTPTAEETAVAETESSASDDGVVDRTGEGSIEIELGDADEQPFAFDPDHVRITTGTSVTWVNTHDVFHTVTSTDSLDEKRSNGEFDEVLSSEGETAERVFDQPGTVFYYCQPHSSFMDGTIEVVE